MKESCRDLQPPTTGIFAGFAQKWRGKRDPQRSIKSCSQMHLIGLALTLWRGLGFLNKKPRRRPLLPPPRPFRTPANRRLRKFLIAAAQTHT
jgi:hypothetical protein